MKPFLLMKIILNMNTLLKELDIFDFSKFNDLINGLENIVSTINSIHDTCEYFCNSF